MTLRDKFESGRIISVNRNIGGLPLAGSQDVAWPCHVFRISLPVRSSAGPNIFESAVLRLAAIGYKETAELARTLCLEIELVRFIQSRLQQSGFLQSDFSAGEEGRKWLHNFAEKPLEYTALYAYLELVSGCLLPVFTREIAFENCAFMGEKLNFNIGSIDWPCPISAFILDEEKVFLEKRPGSEDILQALHKFKKLQNIYNVLQEKGCLEIQPSSASAISVHSIPEPVYLHCDLILPQGSTEFVFTDPFGYGFSDIMTNAFNSRMKKGSREENILTGLRKGAVRLNANSITENTQTLKPGRGIAVGSAFDRIRESFGRAGWKLQGSEKILVDSSNLAHAQKELIFDGVKALYDSLEWTFYQLVSEWPVESWEDVFAGGSMEENGLILKKMAVKAGLAFTEDNYSLFMFSPAKIKARHVGVAEISPLLALCLVAAVDNQVHPLRRLSRNFPDFPDFLCRLRNLRNQVDHGHVSEQLGTEELRKYIEYTISIIRTLCPDINLDVVQKRAGGIISDIDQNRHSLVLKLGEKTGFSLSNRLLLNNRPLYEELLKLINCLNSLHREPEVLTTLVNSASSVLQSSLHQAFCGLSIAGVAANADTGSKLMKREILQKIMTAGFSLKDAKLPVEIKTVSRFKLQTALCGGNSTIGANLLAFVILLSQEKLAEKAAKMPYLIELVSFLIKLRGHGNRPCGELLHDIGDLNIFENEIENCFVVVKLLLEE